MTMFWNRGGTPVASEQGGAASLRVLRAAGIAALAWSCISIASSEELPEPPVVESLPRSGNENFLSSVLNFLSVRKLDAQEIKIVVMAYTEGGTDKLIAFKFDGSPVGKAEKYGQGTFLIPAAGFNFENAIVVWTASSPQVQGCTQPQPPPPGGTPYCNF
jgi:hypothetical protein